MSTDVVLIQNQSIADDSSIFKISRTGLIITGNPTFTEWQNYGNVLRYVEGSIHWALGDWLNYGEQTYGEMYSQALEITDYTKGTLRNSKWVASVFDLSCRHDNLPFSYHQEVATLMKDDLETASELLDMAETETWKLKELRQAVKEVKRKQFANASIHLSTPDDFTLLFGDMQDECKGISDNSIDLILTDPPYPQEYLPLWDELAFMSQRVLKPSGWLITYSGSLHLNYVMNTLSKQLSYYWQLCLRHREGTQLIHPRNIIAEWKPILIFQKEPISHQEQTIVDLIDFEKMDKKWHDWQQGAQAPAFLIENFSKQGDTVLDCFSGSGTFPITAYKMNRKAIAIDNDEQNINIMKGLLNGIQNE